MTMSRAVVTRMVPALLLCQGALAQTGLVDLTVPAGSPAYTPAAPVHLYVPAIDAANPRLPMSGGGPDNSAQTVSFLVSTGGNTGLDATAAILDRDAGDTLAIKVQGQDLSGLFSHIGFYHTSISTGGWAGMTGGAAFFALAPADKFTSARMTVTHDGAGNVTLTLTEVVGGTNPQVYTRGGWTPRAGAGAGLNGFTGLYSIDNFGVAFTGQEVCDPFNRANGGMGPNWVFTMGNGSVDGNAAKIGAGGQGIGIYIGSCGSVVQECEADIAIAGPGINTNVGLNLNDNGSDNVHVKIQRQVAGPNFSHIGFYHQLGSIGPWPGQTGSASFFALAAGDEFASAHMKLSLFNNGVVRLVFSNINGSATNVQEYQRGNWIVLTGGAVGFGGWNGDCSLDNFSANGGLPCDRFNRADGPLGPNWSTPVGGAAIVSNTARGGTGGTNSRSMFLGTCAVCYADCNNDGSLTVADFTCFQTRFNNGVAGACP